MNITKELEIMVEVTINLFDTEFKKRLISSLFLILIFLLIFFLGLNALLITLVFVVYFLFRELDNLLKKKNYSIIFLLSTIIFYGLDKAILNRDFEIYFLIIFYVFTSMLIYIIYFKKYNLFTFFISFLINSLFFSFYYIIDEYKNINFILLLISLISVSDIMAYLSGKNFGKKKIFPKISPNKTITGTVTGVLSTIPIAYFYAVYYKLDEISYILFGLIIGILGLFGDLLISHFKRMKNVKDAGSLIPGHGGLLDRFDSYLLTIPSTIILVNFFLKV